MGKENIKLVYKKMNDELNSSEREAFDEWLDQQDNDTRQFLGDVTPGVQFPLQEVAITKCCTRMAAKCSLTQLLPSVFLLYLTGRSAGSS
jgi:hypothetical protein